MKKLYYTLLYCVLLGIPSFVISRFVTANIKALSATIFVSIIIGQVLELWAVRHGKKDKSFVWDYSYEFTLGPKIFDVPIEDFVIFLILTPVFIVYFYEWVKSLMM